MRHPPIARLVEALRHAADLAESKGDEALRLARDWSTPLGASGEGAGGKGGVNRPTENAAVHPDPLAHHYAAMVAEMEKMFDAAVGYSHRVLLLTENARRIDPRAGIGYCEGCGRYCVGGKTDRLRNDLCPGCHQRMLRLRAVGTVGTALSWQVRNGGCLT